MNGVTPDPKTVVQSTIQNMVATFSPENRAKAERWLQGWEMGELDDAAGESSYTDRFYAFLEFTRQFRPSSLRTFAEKLHSDLFYMRHAGTLGKPYHDIPLDKLKSFLNERIRGVGVVPTDKQLDFLVGNFPPVDLTPNDAMDMEPVYHERTMMFLTGLLLKAIPDMARLG